MLIKLSWIIFGDEFDELQNLFSDEDFVDVAWEVEKFSSWFIHGTFFKDVLFMIKVWYVLHIGGL